MPKSRKKKKKKKKTESEIKNGKTKLSKLTQFTQYKIKLENIEIALIFHVTENFPYLQLITRTTINEIIHDWNKSYPNSIHVEIAITIHNVMNGIIQNLSRLSLFLDNFKVDKDIPYLIQNLKEHCKTIMQYINLAGVSVVDESVLRENFYQITFKLYRILGLIDILKENIEIPNYYDVNVKSIQFNDNFIILIEAIYRYLTKKEKDITNWYLGKKLAKILYDQLTFMYRTLCSYYFIVRSSNYLQKEMIIFSIYRTLFFIDKVRSRINFNIGYVFKNIRDFINQFTKYENNFRELIGYLEVFFQSFNETNNFKLVPYENNLIELYSQTSCRMCKEFYDNRLFEHVQDCSINLQKGLVVYDIDKSINALAKRYFYDIEFVPSLYFPTLENNYSLYHVSDPFKDENRTRIKEACKVTSKEISDYLFGPYVNVIPSHTYSSKEKEISKTKQDYIKRLTNLRIMYQDSTEVGFTKKEIAKELGDNYNTIDYFVKKCLKTGVLYTDDADSVRKKSYKLDFEKFNIEIQKATK